MLKRLAPHPSDLALASEVGGLEIGHDQGGHARVADVLAVAIDRERLARDRVDDHQRDQLFGELQRAVIIRAVGRQRR